MGADDDLRDLRERLLALVAAVAIMGAEMEFAAALADANLVSGQKFPVNRPAPDERRHQIVTDASGARQSCGARTFQAMNQPDRMFPVAHAQCEFLDGDFGREHICGEGNDWRQNTLPRPS